MQRLAVFLGLLCCLLAVCCAPRATLVTRATDVTTVRAYRTLDLTLHADSDFTAQGRALIEQAAAKWGELSRGNVKLRVKFDVDFSSVANLRAHKLAGHSMVLAVQSGFPIAQELDAVLGGPGRVPMAATVRQHDDGPAMVFLIMDRIQEPDAFLSVVTHEFGHVVGLPDLPNTGSVMSGARVRDESPVVQFNDADIALCRAARYCE